MSEPVPPTDLYEFRALPFRVLYGVRPKQLIVLLLGLRKQGNKLPKGDVALAQDYWNDYCKRCAHDEEGVNEDFDH